MNFKELEKNLTVLKTIFSLAALFILGCIYAQSDSLSGRIFYKYSLDDTLKTDSLEKEKISLSSGISTENIRKKGVIYRGVKINADSGTGVISGLNLELEGNISDSISVEAYLSDEQLAISEEGSTESFSDIEKIYIQFRHPNFITRVGDFRTEKKAGQFGDIEKEMSGALLVLKRNRGSVSGYISAESSKSTSFTSRGSEGISGPYVLLSSSDTKEEIVSGSETVYLNGKKLTGGVDYYIDYESSELFFKHGYHITSNDIITADFRYLESDYKKLVYGFDAEDRIMNNKLGFKTGFYREEEDRDKPLNYDLNDSVVSVLESDRDDHVFISGAEFMPGKGKYDLLPDSVHFIYTGAGGGDYNVRFTYFETVGEYDISYDSLGAAYYVYDPVNGGDYLPLVKIKAPGSYSRFHTITDYHDEFFKAEAELAVSSTNDNTFYSDDLKFKGYGDREKFSINSIDSRVGKFEMNAQRKHFNKELVLPTRKSEVRKENEIETGSYSDNFGMTEYSGGIVHYFRDNSISGYTLRQSDYGKNISEYSQNFYTRGDFAPYHYSGSVSLSKLDEDSVSTDKFYGDLYSGYRTEKFRSGLFFKNIITNSESASEYIKTDKKNISAEIGIKRTEKADIFFRSEFEKINLLNDGSETENLRRYINTAQIRSRISSILNSEIFWSRSDNVFRSADSSDTKFDQLNFKLNFNDRDRYRIFAEYETERTVYFPKVRTFYKVAEGTGSYTYNNGEYFYDDFGNYDYYVSASDRSKELNGVKLDIKSYFDFEDRQSNDNILYYLSRIDIEQDLKISEKTSGEKIYDLIFLNLSEFQTDSTVAGTIESRTGLYFMKKSSNSYEYRFNYIKNRFSEYSNYSDNSLLKEHMIAYKNISGKVTNFSRGKYSENERVSIGDIKTDDIAKKYVSYGIKYNFNRNSFVSGEFEYGNENEKIRKIVSDSYRISVSLNVVIVSGWILRLGFDAVEVVSENSLPYSMNSGYGTGWSYKWNLSSDYKYNDSVRANLVYTGRYLSSDPKPFHELKAEVIMDL